MNLRNKVIVIFYIILAILYSVFLINYSASSDNPEIPNGIFSVNEIIIVKEVELDKIDIFNVMTDVHNYPKILPQNVISVNILNQTKNIIFAEEEVIENHLRLKMMVKHTFVPYNQHVIEILNGDAKGTKIIQTFEENNSTTKITTKIEFKLNGILEFIKYFTQSSLEHAMNTVLDDFIKYSKGFDNSNEKIVDDLYRELLHRPADVQGLEHYGSLLESNQINQDDLRNTILESDEKKSLLEFDDKKTMSDLSNDSKKIVDDLYRELLHRPADVQGLEHYGSLLESNQINQDDLRNTIFNSKEGLNIRLAHPVIRIIDDAYVEVFDKHADEEIIMHYYDLVVENKLSTKDLISEFSNSTFNP
jgi:ribosome-associated toxin RatA of RatAB toxin-antitoxin module